MPRPSKYEFLEKIKASGINTPETLFLEEKNLTSENYKSDLEKFISKNKSNFYIIRSCIFGEDGSENSFAGHFESSHKLKAKDLKKYIKIYFKKNKKIQKKLILKGETNLMVQTFIESDFGGVLFSSWKYFTEHFLVEYSVNGAEDSVEGKNSEFLLLSKNNFLKSEKKQTQESCVFNKKYPEVLNHLKDLVLKAENIFTFPFDVEWCVKNKEIFFLQLRPITQTIYALNPASRKNIQEEKDFLTQKYLASKKEDLNPKTTQNKSQKKSQNKKEFHFEINSFSESFGVISPLSFSIIESCFKNNLTVFRDLGFLAKNFDFLWRSRNGQIYSFESAFKNFFKFKSFFTPFWQKIQEKKFLEKSENFIKKIEKNQNIKNQDFDLDLLHEIFGFWNIANFYAGQNPKNIKAESFSDEYEVLKVLDIKFPQYQNISNPKSGNLASLKNMPESWSFIRNYLKKLWLFEYNKLKKNISQQKILAFGEIEDLEKCNNVAKNNFLRLKPIFIKKINQKYKEEFPFSVYDFPAQFSDKNKSSKIFVVKGDLNGKKFVVKNPKLFRGKFAENIILVAPYFENSWILEIDKFSGIILEQGGFLSHSAIIAREKKIPYVIGWKNAVKEFEPQ